MVVPTLSNRPSWLRVWLTAARPHTLTASIAPCLVTYGATRPPYLAVWTLFCLTVQLGTNLHNDYSDFVQGADNDQRVGQKRATAQGWLSPTTTCIASTVCLSITAGCGVYLAIISEQTANILLWFIIISSVACAYAYTGGPFPFGYLGLPSNTSIAYAGLGEVFVLLYFGYAAVLTLPYILSCQGFKVDWVAQLSYGTSVGLLATNILVVNNLRDRHTDVRARKMTTAVRFGKRFSILEYRACVAVSYALVLFNYWWNDTNAWHLLPLLSLPLALKEAQAVSIYTGSALNAHVGKTAMVQFVFCILLTIGLYNTI